MRSKIYVFLMLGLVVSLCALTTLAQADEQKAQLFFIEEAVVKPSMVDKYEAHAKEAIGLCVKYGLPFPFYAFTTDDLHYYFVWPIENYASLDSLFKALGGWVEKMGDENWQALVKSGEGTHEYMKWSIIRHRPELSYTPEKPRLKPEEANFVVWIFCYVQPGKEREFEEICKEWVTLYKRKNIPEKFDTYAGDIGTDMPFYFLTGRAKNAIDFYIQDEKEQEILGEEYMALLRKTLATLKELKFKTGWFRSDLSYMPEEKQSH